jgi:hypothetical protein
MIEPIKQNISFGYKSVLKTEWRAGNLPTVKKDVYGDDLVKATVEHIIPVSKGGAKALKNIGLANEATNNLRSNKDILEFTTLENLVNWFKQFIGVKTKKFNGDEYIKNALKYLGDNGIKINLKG